MEMVNGHTWLQREKNPYKLRPGCCWQCTLIRLIPLSASSQNRRYWVHVNASYEGRSHSACKPEWKNKTRVLKISPWLVFSAVWIMKMGERQKKLFVLRSVLDWGFWFVEEFTSWTFSAASWVSHRLLWHLWGWFKKKNDYKMSQDWRLYTWQVTHSLDSFGDVVLHHDKTVLPRTTTPSEV